MRRLNVILLVGLGLLLLFGPYLTWLSYENVPLKTLILNKTVPDTKYDEHRGLMWLLNHYKLFTLQSWELARDYAGFHPSEGIVPLPGQEQAASYDLIYIADSYGVYNGQDVIYGGIKLDEVNNLMALLKPSGTLMAEYHTFSPPTSRAVRARLEGVFGLAWSGWNGCYYSNLSKAPLTLQQTYRKYYDQTWSFSGAGMVFSHEDERILVLKLGKELKDKGLKVRLSLRAQARYDLKLDAYYSGCFDIVAPSAGAETVAIYSLVLSDAGQSKLATADIPDSFPAVIGYRTRGYQSYYFAGNYARLEHTPPHFLSGLPNLYRALPLSKSSQSHSYWKFYAPLMRKMFEDILLTRYQ